MNKTENMKVKPQIIEHESFANLFTKNNEIFTKLFGRNKFGADLIKFGTLVGRINSVCEKLMPEYIDTYPDDYNKPGSGLNRFKGDVFEIFINAFLLILGSNANVAVYGYEPVEKKNDWGVDGHGKGSDDKALTVQVKFRSEYGMELKSEDIGQFPYQSILAYGVEINNPNNLLLITSCKGLNPITATQVFRGTIREINGEMIRNLIDDNRVFWKNLLDIIDNTIKCKYGHDRFYSVGLMNTSLCEE